MAVVLVIGILLTVVGLGLLFNVFGAGDYVIRSITSKYLGSLPPGFAASKRGFHVYATLLIAIGIVCIGLGVTDKALPIGAGLIVVGAVIFGIASVIAISGEVETSRRGR